MTPEPRKKSDGWLEFCEAVDMTPPKTLNLSFDEMVATAESLLVRGGGPKWEHLDPLQQSMMAFMLNKGVLQYFKDMNTAAHRMTHALENNSNEYTHLKMFVIKGGDHVIRDDKATPLAQYEKFLKNHSTIWKEDRSNWKTIFSIHPSIEPHLRLQEEYSNVCVWLSLAIAVHYAQLCRCRKMKQETDEIAEQIIQDSENGPRHLVMNVSRAIREIATAEEIYEYIFNSDGFNVAAVHEAVLKETNPKLNFLRYVDFDKNRTRDQIYSEVSDALECGCLLIDYLEVYEGYANCESALTRTQFGKGMGSFHACCVVGVARTPDDDKTGGIVFLVQDTVGSCRYRNVSLNLLLAMKINYLIYFSNATKFPDGSPFDISPDFAMSVSGGVKGLLSPTTEARKEAYYAPGGPYELWRYMMDPNYTPSWASQLGYTCKP
jgi:hypothetical protein